MQTLGSRYHPVASHTLQVTCTAFPFPTRLSCLTLNSLPYNMTKPTGLPPRRLRTRRPPPLRLGHTLRRRALRHREPGRVLFILWHPLMHSVLI